MVSIEATQCMRFMIPHVKLNSELETSEQVCFPSLHSCPGFTNNEDFFPVQSACVARSLLKQVCQQAQSIKRTETLDETYLFCSCE